MFVLALACGLGAVCCVMVSSSKPGRLWRCAMLLHHACTALQLILVHDNPKLEYSAVMRQGFSSAELSNRVRWILLVTKL
jgi:hypothetical protein